MDYLLRDSYFTGASYGEFDLTRILRVIRPVENGIAFQRNGMHAIDYVLSRYQMYMQVYFHPATRAMEVLLQNLLKRAKELYLKTRTSLHALLHISFLSLKKNDLVDYLALDDGVMNTYFQLWMTSLTRFLQTCRSVLSTARSLNPLLFSQKTKTTRNHETTG